MKVMYECKIEGCKKRFHKLIEIRKHLYAKGITNILPYVDVYVRGE